MKKIVSQAGFLLTEAIDKLENAKSLSPIFLGYKEGSKEIRKTINGLSLEQSIPKAVSIYEENRENVDYAALIFPAELNYDDERKSVIMVMAQNYQTQDYIIVSLPYSKKSDKIEVLEFELMDYSPFLIEQLPELEKSFVDGLLSYGDSKEIWKR